MSSKIVKMQDLTLIRTCAWQEQSVGHSDQMRTKAGGHPTQRVVDGDTLLLGTGGECGSIQDRKIVRSLGTNTLEVGQLSATLQLCDTEGRSFL